MFFVIDIPKEPDTETLGYLEAHGLKYVEKKLIIPARCKFLSEDNQCLIEKNKFDICSVAGKKECEEARRIYDKLVPF